MAKCPDCFSIKIALGEEEGDGKCDRCYGEGTGTFLETLADGITGERTPCSKCYGTGQCQYPGLPLAGGV